MTSQKSPARLWTHAYAAIWKPVSGEEEYLFDWRAVADAPREPRVTLQASCTGNILPLSANGAALAQAHDSAYRAGGFAGLFR